MRKNISQTGSAHVVIAVVIVIALIGALGFIFWNNFINKNADVSQADNKPKVEEPCSNGGNVAAEKGIFCSKEIRIKFEVPSIFAGKFIKADNYEVFEGPLDSNTKKKVGISENVYKATIRGKDNFLLTVAQEPIRTGYVGTYHKLQDTYYDQKTGDLTSVNTPDSLYDAATDTLTTSGEYSKGEVVPSMDVNGIRFFKGSNGDAGQIDTMYFGIVDNKIVKISLTYSAYIGDPASDPTTIDADKVFNEFDTFIQALKVIKS